MSNSAQSSSLGALAFSDLNREIAVTRRVLERLPEEKFAWKAHEKSMTLGNLAMHVVNLFQWMVDTLNGDGLDLATIKPPRTTPRDRDDLLRTFEQYSSAAKKALARMDEVGLSQLWTLRRGDQVMHTQPRALILRVWCLSHLIHHRAQLCVYLRMLDIPVPAVYFNSSDEPEWMFT